jgi:hypothetical protein
MSEMNKLGFEPIPLGGLPPRSTTDMASLGLLPPLPKPAQPVEPRSALPRTEMPTVKAAAIESAPEPPKPPLPGRLAWVPEAMSALAKPSKQKGIIMAGVASLLCGAWVASWMWPTPVVKQDVEVAKAEAPLPTPPESKPVIVQPSTPAVKVELLAPVVLPQLSVTRVEVLAFHEVAPAPRMAPPATEISEPVKVPTKIESNMLKMAPPVVHVETPQKLELPEIQLPAIDTNVKPAGGVEAAAIHVPVPPAIPPAAKNDPAKTATPAAPKSELTLPPVTAPALPEIKVAPAPPTMEPKVTAPLSVTIPETKPTAPPLITIPETKEPTFQPSGNSPKNPEVATPQPPVIETPKPSSPPLDLPRPIKPTGAMTPREDYDVDVHYPAAGDTWASISKQQLGDERYGEALKAYNSGRALAANQGVDVPPIHVLRKQYANLIAAPRAVEPVLREVPRPGGGQRTYEIPAGGLTMKELAKKALGDENYWGQIWELNPKLRADEPVPAGTKIKLPTDSRIGE